MTEARQPASELLGDGLRPREGMADAMSLRVGVVLRRHPGLTIAEIHADLRANNYVATPEAVAAALDRSPSDFRCEEMGATARWFAVLTDRDLRDQEASTWSGPSVDAEAIRKITRVYRIVKLWHWSPAAAMRSILEHGLLAPRELDRRGIRYQANEYGSREKALVLGSYVSTSLKPKTMMMLERSENSIIWELDPDVATGDGTLFVPDNSAKAQVDLASVLRSTGRDAYWAAIRAFRTSGSQVEILVPRAIPLAALRAMFVYRVETADTAERWVAEMGVNLTVVRMATAQRPKSTESTVD